MAKDIFEFRVPYKKLLLGLGLTVVPICLLALYSITITGRELKRDIGTHFVTIAQGAASELTQFKNDRVVQVNFLAAMPQVYRVIADANRSYTGMSEESIQKLFMSIEDSWNTPAAASRVDRILNNDGSRVLRDFLQLDRRFLRITVTDAKGATVAATHKTLDYYQADEEFWLNIYDSARGAVSVTDVLHDSATKSYYIGVGVPVYEPGTHTFAGVVDALVDVSALFPLVERVQLGSTGRVSLLKNDGTVIASPRASLAMNVKASDWVAIEDVLGQGNVHGSGFLVARVPGGAERVLAYADTGLLGWFIVASQESREAMLPIKAAEQLFILMAVIGLLAVTFLTVYFTLHRRVEFTDIESVRETPASKSVTA